MIETYIQVNSTDIESKDEWNNSIWHGRSRMKPGKRLISVEQQMLVVRLSDVFEDSIVKIQVEGQVQKRYHEICVSLELYLIKLSLNFILEVFIGLKK